MQRWIFLATIYLPCAASKDAGSVDLRVSQRFAVFPYLKNRGGGFAVRTK
ncbi:hypothetical protein [Paenibacillus sp. GCM10027626]